MESVLFFGDNDQLAEGSILEASEVDVRFRGSKANQGRQGAVLVRTRSGLGGGEDVGAVVRLVELFRMYNDGELAGEAPLMSYRGSDGWRVWSRGKGTWCLKKGFASVGKRGERRQI